MKNIGRLLALFLIGLFISPFAVFAGSDEKITVVQVGMSSGKPAIEVDFTTTETVGTYSLVITNPETGQSFSRELKKNAKNTFAVTNFTTNGTYGYALQVNNIKLMSGGVNLTVLLKTPDFKAQYKGTTLTLDVSNAKDYIDKTLTLNSGTFKGSFGVPTEGFTRTFVMAKGVGETALITSEYGDMVTIPVTIIEEEEEDFGQPDDSPVVPGGNDEEEDKEEEPKPDGDGGTSLTPDGDGGNGGTTVTPGGGGGNNNNGGGNSNNNNDDDNDNNVGGNNNNNNGGSSNTGGNNNNGGGSSNTGGNSNNGGSGSSNTGGGNSNNGGNGGSTSTGGNNNNGTDSWGNPVTGGSNNAGAIPNNNGGATNTNGGSSTGGTIQTNPNKLTLTLDKTEYSMSDSIIASVEALIPGLAGQSVVVNIASGDSSAYKMIDLDKDGKGTFRATLNMAKEPTGVVNAGVFDIAGNLVVSATQEYGVKDGMLGSVGNAGTSTGEEEEDPEPIIEYAAVDLLGIEKGDVILSVYGAEHLAKYTTRLTIKNETAGETRSYVVFVPDGDSRINMKAIYDGAGLYTWQLHSGGILLAKASFATPIDVADPGEVSQDGLPILNTAINKSLTQTNLEGQNPNGVEQQDVGEQIAPPEVVADDMTDVVLNEPFVEEKDNKMLYIIIGASVLLLFLIIFLIIRKRKKAAEQTPTQPSKFDEEDFDDEFLDDEDEDFRD